MRGNAVDSDGVSGPIRVGVRGLPPVVADGVRGWVRRDARMVPVGEGDPADVVVLDPLGEERALWSYGKTVVAFSPAQPPEVIAAVLDAGVGAFVSQNEHRRSLLDAVVTAATGRPCETNASPVPRLSERERTALQMWLRSMTKASVARRMGVSPHTVDMYIKRIRAKYADLGHRVPTKADLLARAMADGLVGTDDLFTR